MRMKVLCISAAVLVLQLVAPLVQSANAALLAKIDLSSQRMTVLENGTEVDTWRISSGARGHETPTGSFRPQWTAKTWFSKKYDDAPMPNSVFFNGGIATHGTQSIGRLGSPASHGCIRLAPDHAAQFYNMVQKHGLGNTRIIVSGEAPTEPERIARRSRDQDGAFQVSRRSNDTYVYVNRGYRSTNTFLGFPW